MITVQHSFFRIKNNTTTDTNVSTAVQIKEGEQKSGHL